MAVGAGTRRPGSAEGPARVLSVKAKGRRGATLSCPSSLSERRKLRPGKVEQPGRARACACRAAEMEAMVKCGNRTAGSVFRPGSLPPSWVLRGDTAEEVAKSPQSLWGSHRTRELARSGERGKCDFALRSGNEGERCQ